jgi:sugar lactone lactonase YvrE
LAAPGQRVASFSSAILVALLLIVATPRSGHALIGPTTPTFALGWGTAGSSPGQFNSPWGCTTDALGNVIVVDRANGRIQKFDCLGNWSMTIGGLTDPLFVALSSAGELYVADHAVVKKYDANGNLLLQWGSAGSGPGQFQAASGIAVDAAGNVYVADSTGCRVQKFSSAGVFVTQWGSPGSGNGQFNGPMGICCDAAGNLYVADQGNNRIQEFTGAGTYVAQWGGAGSGNGQFGAPASICTDAIGNCYVGDEGNHRVQKFSPTFAYVTQWGTAGTGDGQFTSPVGIAVDAAGNVYVTDIVNDRVQKFSGAGVAPAAGAPVFTEQWTTYNSQAISPRAVSCDAAGNVYVLDTNTSTIDVFSPSGGALFVFGSEGTGPGQYFRPNNFAFDATGNMFITY